MDNKAGARRAPFAVHALGAWLNGRAFDVIKKHGLSLVVAEACVQTVVSNRSHASVLAHLSRVGS